MDLNDIAVAHIIQRRWKIVKGRMVIIVVTRWWSSSGMWRRVVCIY